MVNKRRKYRDELVQRVKDAGQELIDRAEQMVDKDTDAMTDFNIFLNFNPEEAIPTVVWTTTALVKNTWERLTKKENGYGI